MHTSETPHETAARELGETMLSACGYFGVPAYVEVQERCLAATKRVSGAFDGNSLTLDGIAILRDVLQGAMRTDRIAADLADAADSVDTARKALVHAFATSELHEDGGSADIENFLGRAERLQSALQRKAEAVRNGEAI